jgi:hypothetical protein
VSIFNRLKSIRSLSPLFCIASLLRTHPRAVDVHLLSFPVPDFLLTNYRYNLSQRSSQVCMMETLLLMSCVYKVRRLIFIAKGSFGSKPVYWPLSMKLCQYSREWMLPTMAGQVQTLYGLLTFPPPSILISPCSHHVISLQDEIGGDCAGNISNDYPSHEGTCNGLRMLPTFALQLLLLQQCTEYDNRQSLGCSPVKFHFSLKTSQFYHQLYSWP